MQRTRTTRRRASTNCLPLAWRTARKTATKSQTTLVVGFYFDCPPNLNFVGSEACEPIESLLNKLTGVKQVSQYSNIQTHKVRYLARGVVFFSGGRGGESE